MREVKMTGDLSQVAARIRAAVGPPVAATDGIGAALARMRSPAAREIDTAVTEALRQRAKVPFDTLDVLVELNAHLSQLREDTATRDRWMLGMTAALLLLTALIAVLTMLLIL